MRWWNNLVDGVISKRKWAHGMVLQQGASETEEENKKARTEARSVVRKAMNNTEVKL